MKSKLILFISIVICTTLITSSCSKENSINVKNSDRTAYTPEAMKLYNQLQGFKDKLNNSSRDGEQIEPDSAIWYIEALFNATNCYADSTYGELYRDSTNYQLPINNNGMIDMTDISNVLNQMEADLDYTLSQFDNTVKFLYGSNIEKGTSRESNLDLYVYNSIGLNILGMYDPFEDTDDWYPCNLLGYCDGTGGNSDGGQELQTRLNDPNFAPETPGNTWINVERQDAWWEEYPTDENPFGDYRLFYDDTAPANDPPCMENEELDYYLISAHQIIYAYQSEGGERPDGKDMQFVRVWTNNPGTAPYFHNYAIDYGERINIPPIE